MVEKIIISVLSSLQVNLLLIIHILNSCIQAYDELINILTSKYILAGSPRCVWGGKRANVKILQPESTWSWIYQAQHLMT